MQPKGRIHWQAVILGYGADFLISLVVFNIAASLDAGLADGSLLDSATGVVTAVLLVMSTVFGGWLAARIAKEERFLHGFLVGGIGIVMLLLDSLFGGAITLDSMILQFVATGLAGVAGYLSGWSPARLRKR